MGDEKIGNVFPEVKQVIKTTEEYLMKRVLELEQQVEQLTIAQTWSPNRDLLIQLKEDEISNKDSIILKLNKDCDAYRATIKSKQEFLNSITPTQVYHHKERGNTTVKFFDGSSITVKKMKGDKDCLETAIVWAIFKKMYPSGLMRHLIKNTIETGGK